jgi:hypothetical protein
MADVRFDQFVDGGEMQIGDIPVGLRTSDLTNNFKFNFPGSGIKDSSGNYLFQYETVGALAINALKLINSISGTPTILTASGPDLNIDISIIPVGDGVLTLDTLAWPISDGLPGSFLITDGAGHLQFTNGSIITYITGTNHQVYANNTFGIPQTGSVLLTLPQDIDTTSSPTFDAPIFTAPLLGTPASGILTNCTGLPLTTGVTGILLPINGGTGVNNGASTLTLGGSLTTAGAFASTFTMTGTTNVTFPTSGTLATTSQLPIPAALTEVDDTNVTMTLGGTPATALLQAVSMTLGWTGELSPTRGGTGVNNGASTLTLGGSLTTAGAFASTFTMTGTTNVTFPTIGTLATTSQLPIPAALTEVNDTNVTMTLGGTPATALLQAVSMTLGWTGELSPTRGGTGVNNGASTLTLGGSLTTAGAFASTFTMTGTTNVTFPTSGTLATTSQLPIPAALTEIDDTNVTMTLGGTPATALLQAVSMTLGWTGQLSLARGGTNANLTASNGGIVYSTASELAILAGTSTANQMLQSGASSSPAWSSATWPSTTTINQLLYSSATNTVSGLTTNNSALLITTASGIPQFTTSLTDGQLVIGSTGNSPAVANLIGGTNVTITNGPGSITINAAGSGVVPAALTEVNDTNVTMTLGGTPATALLQAVSMTLGWTGQLSLARGGTNANLTASNGAIVYSTASTLALTSPLTNGQLVIGSTGSAPVTTTLTAGANVTITNGPGSITINAAGSGVVPAALTEVNDTNVTMTLGGTPATALLQAVSMTLGWTGQLSPIRGGTGVNNGASTLTLGGSLTTAGAFASTFTMTGTTNVTFPTIGTLATTSQLPIPAALTRVNDTNVTMTLGGTPATALLQAVSMTLGWRGQLSLARGGTNANLTASNGAIVYSTASALALTSPLTNGQLVIGSTGAAPVTTTLTAGANVTITNGPGSITISSTGGGGGVTPSPLTEVNDTNVTMTLGGTPATALLQAVSMTLGWTGQLSLARGGTNANLTASNGAIVYSTASALALTSPLTNGQLVIGSTGAAPVTTTLTAGANVTITNGPGSITISSTGGGGGVTPSPLTEVNDTNVTMTLGGTPATALLQAVSMTLGWTGTLSVTRGGTGNGSHTPYAVLCGGTTSTSAVQSIASVGTSGQVLTSNGAGALPTFQSVAASTGRLINVQVFKTSGTYTPTSGMTHCIIQCVGGGGAGGGAPSNITSASAAGGGGSGGFSQSYVTSATIGGSQAVTIGAGGTGVSNGNGNAGANTSVGAIVIARGGSGAPVAGAIGSVVQFYIGAAGGVVGTGDITFEGSPGDNGVGGSGATQTISGSGGNSCFGGGGRSIQANGTGSSATANSGGGGAGGASFAGGGNQAGGNGGSGIVIIYEYS